MLCEKNVKKVQLHYVKLGSVGGRGSSSVNLINLFAWRYHISTDLKKIIEASSG